MEEKTITSEEAQQMRKECEAKIALSDAVIRLNKSKDFKMLMSDYLSSEPTRLVQLLGDPSFNFSDKRYTHREEIKERMIGIARFAEYLRGIHLTAERAEKTIQDLDSLQFTE